MITFLLGIVVGSIGGMTLMEMFASEKRCDEFTGPTIENQSDSD